MSITVFTVATVCLNTFVTGLELSGEEANWGGATQAAGSNIPVIGGLVKLASDKRARCCDAQLKALRASLEKFMESENYSDPEAVMADLEQFAPVLVKATQVKPSDLGGWNGEATDSIAQKATEIAMAKYPDACVELIADSKETRPKFLNKNDPRYKATALIIGKLNTVFFAPISVHDAALRQELQAIGIDLKGLRAENRDAHAKTHEQTEEILALLKSKMGNDAVSEEALNNIREALPKVVEHLEKSNTPEADDAEQALKKGDAEKAARLLIEKSDEKAAAAKDAQEFAVSKNIEAAEEARLAGALFFLNNTHEAFDAYQKSTELDPENADGWNQLGHLQRRVGELDEAIACYKRVLELGRQVSDQVLIAVAYGNLGIVYDVRGDLDDAEAMYRKSLVLHEELGRKEGMANNYGNLGIVYRIRGDLDEAEAMCRKAIVLHEELGRKEGMANQYGNLGIVYRTRGDLDEAEAMYRKSLELSEELGSKEGMARVYGNLGIVYRMRGDLDEAEAMYRKSLEIDEELGSKEGMVNQYGNLGNVCQTRGDLDEAARYWTLSLNLAREMGAKGLASQVEGFFTKAELDIPPE